MQSTMFAAFRHDDCQLVLVVEAGSKAEAVAFLEHVAPLLGYVDALRFVLVEIDATPIGIPIFFKKFYSGAAIAFTRSDVAPSTRTLQ